MIIEMVWVNNLTSHNYSPREYCSFDWLVALKTSLTVVLEV